MIKYIIKIFSNKKITKDYWYTAEEYRIMIKKSERNEKYKRLFEN